MVAKETVVFTGPDLGHARVTTPPPKEEGETSLVGYPPLFFLTLIGHRNAAKIASSRWRTDLIVR